MPNEILYFIFMYDDAKNNSVTAFLTSGNADHANNGKHMNGMVSTVASWHGQFRVSTSSPIHMVDTVT